MQHVHLQHQSSNRLLQQGVGLMHLLTMSSHREQWHSFGGISIDLRLWDIIFEGSKSGDQFEKTSKFLPIFSTYWPFKIVASRFGWIQKKNNKHLHPPHNAFHHAAPGSFKFQLCNMFQRSLSGVFSQTTDDYPPPQGCDAWQPSHPERGLQIDATLLKMVVVSSFCKYYSPYHLGINLCVLELFFNKNWVSDNYTPSPSNWFHFGWNFHLPSFSALKANTPTLVPLWQGYSIHLQNWDNWDNSPGAERHTLARWAVDVPGASRLNQSLDIMGLKLIQWLEPSRYPCAHHPNQPQQL